MSADQGSWSAEKGSAVEMLCPSSAKEHDGEAESNASPEKELLLPRIELHASSRVDDDVTLTLKSK